MIYIFSFHIVTIYRSNWWWSLHSPRWWGKLPLPSSHSKVWQVQRKMVHWKGFNSFPSHVVNKRTGLEDPLLWNMAKKGDISSKEILRIGMFRTPFSIWSKLALPLIQVTSCGQVFKIHFLHWFIYLLSLHFTTLNKTVTWKLLVCTISQGLPKWTWQSRCYNFKWEIFHCAIAIPW